MKAADAVRRWVERVVVGLDLCPFARPVLSRMRVVESHAEELETLLREVGDEIVRLTETDVDTLPTTLVVVPHLLQDFEDYLDAAALVEAAIVQSGLEGTLQLATFHPRYRFGDGPPDDPAHWTNRAPFPVLHLLRESTVTDAVSRHPDPAGIPERNVAHLRALGVDALRALLQ